MKGSYHMGNVGVSLWLNVKKDTEIYYENGCEVDAAGPF
jgi:hypothetical protein